MTLTSDRPRADGWLKRNGRSIFLSPDCYVGVASGVIAAAAATNRDVRANAVTILLPEAGIAVALSAVVLAAMAIFATFFDDWYRRVLEVASGSVGRALTPYRAVATIAGAATLVALIVALAWPALPAGLQAVLFGVATGLAAWAIAGCVQLASLTIWHADQRSQLMRGVEDAKLRVSRLKEKHPA
jgi:hypothetical protein